MAYSRRVAASSVGIDEIRTLDLFAGAGGLSTGFHQADPAFTVVGAVEFDVAAAATFAANHGDVVHVGDITEWVSSGAVPEVDVVVGGPPCQGFSRLNKNRDQDIRNNLWRQYMKAVRLAQPKYFVMENVAALFSTPEYEMLLSAFEPGGALEDYMVQSRVLNAADFGVPQSRKRAIVIGRRRDLAAPGMPLPRSREDWIPSGTVFARTSEEVVLTSVEDPRTTTFNGVDLEGAYRTEELHYTRNYAQLSLDRFRSIPPGGNRFDLPDELKAPCWRRHTKGSGDVMGRLRSERPSVTIRTEFFKPEKGRYLHPTANRAITHREAALLQGFDDDYLWLGTKPQIARQIGNAVPPPLAAAVARRIMEAIVSAPVTARSESDTDRPRFLQPTMW